MVKKEVGSRHNRNAFSCPRPSDADCLSGPAKNDIRPVVRAYEHIKAWKIRIMLAFAIIAMVCLLLGVPDLKRRGLPDRPHGLELTQGEVRYATEKMMQERSEFKQRVSVVQMVPSHFPDKTIRFYYVVFLIRDKFRPEDFLPVIEDKEAFLLRCASADSPEEFYRALVYSRITDFGADVFNTYFYTVSMMAHRDDGFTLEDNHGLPASCWLRAHAVRLLGQIDPNAVITAEYDIYSHFYGLETETGLKYCYHSIDRVLHKTENGCEVKPQTSFESTFGTKGWKEYVEQTRKRWDRYLSGYAGE
jgi:hypothetical protein